MSLTENQFRDAFHWLLQNGSGEEADELVLYQLEWSLVNRIGPRFIEDTHRRPSDVVLSFLEGLENFRNEVDKYLSMLQCRSEGLRLIKASFLNLQTDQWLDTVRSVFEVSCSAFCNDVNAPSPDNSVPCPGCKRLNACVCCEIMDRFQKICQHLKALDLFNLLLPDAIPDIVHSVTEHQIRNTSQSVFGVPHLQPLLYWFERCIYKWLSIMYNPCDQDLAQQEPRTCESLNDLKEQLLEFLYETYGKFLVNEMFSIIIDYPDSIPVIEDLGKCIELSQLRGYLTDKLRTCIQNRLLHPGVNTYDIITAYIQTVKTLRLIDPSGVLMENVCEPIREYLRHRHDTVRCIVSVLTDTKNPEIASEFMQQSQQPESMTSFQDAGWLTDLDAPADWQEWKPDPIDAKPESQSKSRRTADFISMLVNVYGSRELFVKEHSQLLAERLLHATDDDIENEMCYLELLKLRFGENELRNCEVMLKDVKDSNRINNLVTKTIEEDESLSKAPVNISALIISSQFWPNVKQERMMLPVEVEQSLQQFNKLYEKLKASRTLEWHTSAGLVDVELEMGGKATRFSVSPVLAAIIYHFQEKEVWSLDDLCNRLKVSSVYLRNRITWWSCAGVLRECQKDVWCLVSSLPSSEERKITSFFDEEEEDLLTDTDFTNKAPNLEVYWPYISSLLKNIGSLTAERIHKLLKLCSDEGRERTSIEDVTAFLRSKVNDQVLIQVDDAYRIPDH